jgi:hypothetical protein
LNIFFDSKTKKKVFSSEEFLLESSHNDIISFFQVCFQNIGKHLIKHIQIKK